MTPQRQHRCAACRCALSRYNTEDLCAPCSRAISCPTPEGPRVPDHVWDDPEVRHALTHWDFGRASRLVRQQGTLRQVDMASLTGLSQAFLSSLESGGRRLTNIDRIIQFLSGLGTPPDLVRLPLPSAEQRPPNDTQALPAGRDKDVGVPRPLDEAAGATECVRGGTPKEEDGVDRRQILDGLAAFGATQILRGQDEPLDAVRLAFNSSLPGVGPERTVEDWQAVALEYSLSYMSTPPLVLQLDLAADVLAIRQSIEQEADAQRRADLYGVGAMMAAVLAMTTHCLGRSRESRNWWRSARRAADASGERDLRVWVRGYEAMSGLYQKRPPRLVLERADDAIRTGGRRGSPGMMEALACKAQILAENGGASEAHAILDHMRGTFEALPDAQVTQDSSLLTWPQTRLLHTESFVYTATGHVKEADRAQITFLAACPTTRLRDRVQVELHRAACLVGDGDVGDGITHAETVLQDLPAEYHTRSVRVVTEKILQMMPRANSRELGVNAYRERLTAASQEGPKST
jgi:transcriptional regulator with XRE-family HTH domain